MGLCPQGKSQVGAQVPVVPVVPVVPDTPVLLFVAFQFFATLCLAGGSEALLTVRNDSLCLKTPCAWIHSWSGFPDTFAAVSRMVTLANQRSLQSYIAISVATQ